MNSIIEALNLWGHQAVQLAWPMLWQSSVLVALVFAFDLLLHRKVRASVRSALWMLVLVKLLLPPSFALPTGVGRWLQPATPPVRLKPASVVVSSMAAPMHSSVPPSVCPGIFKPVRHLSIEAYAMGVWLGVSVGLLAVMLNRWRRVSGEARCATAVPEALSELLAELRRCAGLRQGVRLRLAESTMSPVVCGLFRPTILLPRSLVERLSPAQLRSVLLHELLHLRRGDVWVNCLQALLQLLYWWHPLLWLANARIRRLREESVDDAVMLALRDDAESYAPALLEVARLALRRPLGSLGFVGILETRKSLKRRIERLVNFRPPRKAGLTLASFLWILAFAAVALPLAPAPTGSERMAGSISGAQTGNTPLVIRILKVDTEAISAYQPGEAAKALREWFRASGVVSPDRMFLNERTGDLFVRGSASDLELIQEGIRRLNETSAARFNQGAESLGNASSTNQPGQTSEWRPNERGTSNLIRQGTNDELAVRIIKVNPSTFMEGLEGFADHALTNQPAEQTAEAAQRLFRSVGVDLSWPKVLTFNKREGSLLVRGSLQDLDVVEAIVQVLNISPPQVNIKVKVLEVEKVADESWKPKGTAGLLTDPQARFAVNYLQQQRGADILLDASVTTLSGRQAQISANDYVPIATNINPQALTAPGVSSPDGLPLIGTFPMGETVDLVVVVAADGRTIHLSSSSTIAEFLGYDEPTNSLTVYVNGQAQNAHAPRPDFRFRQITNACNIPDGQTLVLGGLDCRVRRAKSHESHERTGAPAASGQFLRDSDEVVEKAAFVFITPVIVDPAGNRVHALEDTESPSEGNK